MAVVKFNAISGVGANHLELVPLANNPINVDASTEDADYPATNQINSNAIQPWLPWRAATPDTDDEIVFDKNQIYNPGAETNSLDGWETEGDVLVINSPVNSGSHAFEMNDSEGPASILQNVIVRAGEKISISVAIRGDTGDGEAFAYIEELGLYLQSNGTWSTSDNPWATGTTSSYVTTTVSATVPAYSILVPNGVYTLSCYVELVAAGQAQVDDFFLWHWTDTAGLIGHNVHPVITGVQLRASTDNFGANDTLIYTWAPPGSGDLTTDLTKLRWPTTWAMFTQVGQRWWKFLFSGTNDDAIWTGQCFLAQKFPLDRNPNYGIVVETVLNQVRQETTAGASYVVAKEDIQRRQFRFPWRYHSGVEWQQARDRIFHASQFGQHPTLMIHDDQDAESCALVRPPDKFDFNHKFVNVRDSVDFPLRELAFPTFD